MGCVTGTYSNTHTVISQELAKSNPELTLPLLSGNLCVLCVIVTSSYVSKNKSLLCNGMFCEVSTGKMTVLLE